MGPLIAKPEKELRGKTYRPRVARGVEPGNVSHGSPGARYGR